MAAIGQLLSYNRTMELFTLLEPFLKRGSIISLVGAGGKTSTLYALARSAARRELKSLLTTTTLMIDPGSDPLARGIPVRYGECHTQTRTGGAEAWLLPEPGLPLLFCASERLEEVGKVKGLTPGQINRIAPFWDLLLVEADGAKHRPVKAPAEHEPVIPEQSGIVIGCIGLDCLGKPFSPDTVHRPRYFSQVTGLREGEIITPRTLAALVSHRSGLFKNLPRGAIPIVLLNKADAIDPGSLQGVFKELGSGLERYQESRGYPGEGTGSSPGGSPGKERGEGREAEAPPGAIIAASMQATTPENQIMQPIPQH